MSFSKNVVSLYNAAHETYVAETHVSQDVVLEQETRNVA